MQKWLVIIMVFVVGSVNAQNYNFDYLTIQQGLPQSQVFGICFDNNQYAWMGTQGGGLCRYNGSNYDYFTTQDSLLSNRVYDVKHINNQIWVACKGGVSVFNANGKHHKNIKFTNPNEIAVSVIFFKTQIWVGTDFGVYSINNNQLKSADNPNLKNVYVRSFFAEDDNNLWVNTKTGAFHLTDPFKKLNTNKGLPNDYVTTMVKFSEDWLIGTYGSGVSLYSKTEGIKDVNELAILKNEIILDMLINGTEVWIATMNSGVYIWQPSLNSVKQFNSNNGLSNNHVRILKKDNWGNIWLGTSGGGVSIYNNSPFLEYNKLNGLNSNYIYDVVHDASHNLWVSTEGKGVVRLNDTSKVLFDEEYGYKSVKTKVIFEDYAHNIWFGSEGEGVGLWLKKDQKDTVYRFSGRQGLKNGWVKAIAQSPETGQIVVGTNEGVYVLITPSRVPSDFYFKKLKNKNIPSKITDLCFNADGTLFFSSNKGLAKINKNGEVDFLNQNNRFRNVLFNNNNIYAGTADKGVFQMNLNSQKSAWINTSNWLNSDNVYQLVINGDELWVGTEKGLTKLKLSESEQIVANQFYQYEDGFEGVETNLNAVCLDHQNKMWFGTTNGLFLFNGDVENSDQKKPPVFHLNDIQILYKSILETKYARFFNADSDSVLTLPYNQNHIGFNIEAINYAFPEKIKYRWKLEGADQQWTPISTNGNATYSNLLPGIYTFYAKASVDDNWDVEPVSFSFEIKPPLWEETWFKTMYYASGVAFLGLIGLVFYRRFKRKGRIEKERLEMEKSLLELEQKALRLQMNPHFIFNVLNSIHNQIILNDSAKARYSLAKFSKLMRRVLENSREKLISIDDEVETIENYVQLEKLTNDLEFDFEINIQEDIDTNEQLLPPLMIQPFIENAIIHGIKGLNRKGKISVSFNLPSEHILQCVIEDNGAGRINSAKYNAQKENYHKSTALEVTQERLSNLQPKLSKNTNFKPFQIIDKYNANNEPEGTKIIIQLEI